MFKTFSQPLNLMTTQTPPILIKDKPDLLACALKLLWQSLMGAKKSTLSALSYVILLGTVTVHTKSWTIDGHRSGADSRMLILQVSKC